MSTSAFTAVTGAQGATGADATAIYGDPIADAHIPAAIARDAEVAAAIAALSSVYQPVDSDLTAIAALTTTSYGRAFLALADAAAAIAALGLDADIATLSLPASTTISAFIKTLLDDADAATARTTLGLGTAATSASTDFQPIDSDLTAIAALTTTSFGRSLLAAADAAALRTLAGLGAAALLADPIVAAHGGSGLTSLTAHALQVGNGTGTVTQIGPDASSAKFLASAGSSADPAFRAVAESDVTSLVSDLALKAPLASPALTGTPTAPTQTAGDASAAIATDAFVTTAVNNALSGLDVKPDVAYVSTSALPANTYNNGASGVGATLTGNANGPLIIDGVTLAIGQAGERVLVAGEAAPANNGWYTITQVGVIAVSPYILTRATESDQAAEIGAGYLTGVVAPNTVIAGTHNGNLYISVAADPFTVGTTSLTFSQVGGTYTNGNGISLSGSTFSIDTAVTVDKTTAQTLTTKTLTSPILNTGVSGSAIDTDSAMAANSDTLLPSQKAVKAALDAKQALDADLTTIAGLTATTDNVIQSVGSAWASRTPAQLKATLALVKGDVGLGNVDNTADSAKTFTESQITNLTTDLAAKQPLDSDLTTIAGLTATTDNMIQSVGSAWASRTPAQVRTALGLVVGTDVQAQDAELAAIAGLTSAANKLPYFTGSGTAAVADFTAAGRALVDDADAAAQRTTLGLGGAALVADPVPIANGGTGQTAKAAAHDALSPATTKGDLVVYSTTGARLAAGADGQQIFADATQAGGLSYHTAGWFGDGSDGAVNFDGTTTILGLAPASGVYTLTRNLYCTDLTISGTGSLKLGNFKLFVAGTLSATATSFISNDGGAGAGQTGGVNIAVQVWAATAAGQTGAAGGGAGSSGANTSAAIGGSGGAGGLGTGSPGTGGGPAGGTATAITAKQGGPGIHDVYGAVSGNVFGTGNTSTQIAAGASGGSGAAAAGTGTGGGSGGGGGICAVYARTINVANGVTLTIRALGGNGGNGAAGSSAGTGGGGGGGGGGVLLVYSIQNLNASGTLTLSAAGGSPGTGTGTGRTAIAGSAGTTTQIQV